MSSPQNIDRNQIARKAFEMWESQGRPSGKAEEHWRLAEQQLRADGKTSSPQSSAQSAAHSADDQRRQQPSYTASSNSSGARPARAGK